MSRLIGPKRSAIQSTGRADLGALVRRLSVPPTSGTAQNIIVPSRAIWADVRAVGAGGQDFGASYAGGGGAYARTLLAVTPGETLSAFVSSWYFTGVSYESSLSRGGTVLLSAAPGAGTGAGGQASASIGQVKRDGGQGGDPSSTGWGGWLGAAWEVASNPSSRLPSFNYSAAYNFKGGFAASDIGDFDSLGIGGFGAFDNGGVNANDAGPGGGGFGAGWAGAGAMIIEFYDGQVPQ